MHRPSNIILLVILNGESRLVIVYVALSDLIDNRGATIKALTTARQYRNHSKSNRCRQPTTVCDDYFYLQVRSEEKKDKKPQKMGVFWKQPGGLAPQGELPLWTM